VGRGAAHKQQQLMYAAHVPDEKERKYGSILLNNLECHTKSSNFKHVNTNS
jgi:hypothetical protein